MLGESGRYYRAGYLARRANDWPDGTDGQIDVMPEDVEMEVGPDASTAQQKTSSTPTEQDDASGVAPQSSGSGLLEPQQISAFAAPWRPQETTDSSQFHDEGWEAGTSGFKLPPSPTSSLAGFYGRQMRQNPMSPDTPQAVRGSEPYGFKAPSLFSTTTLNVPPSFMPSQANTGSDRQVPPNQFNVPSPPLSNSSGEIGRAHV